MFEKKIIEEILNAWEADQNHPNRGKEKRALPNIEDVKILVETVFFASLQKEEGIPIKSSFVLADPDIASDDSHRYLKNIFSFKDVVPFGAESIRKVANAFDCAQTAILVGRLEEGGELVCWGASYFREKENLFNQIPCSRPISNGMRLDAFTVTIQSEGCLIISRAVSLIGRFFYGVFTKAHPTVFTSKSLGQFFSGLENNFIEVLLEEVAKLGKGATIIVLPENFEQNEGCKFKSLYSFKEFYKASSFLQEVRDTDVYNTPQIIYFSLRYEVFTLIKSLAKLSCLDGALILDSKMNLVCFGAKLEAPKWEGKVLEVFHGFGAITENEFPIKKYGTRHSSALSFTMYHNGVTAFVVSQDGHVRGFRKSSDEVALCWPDCTVSMFA